MQLTFCGGAGRALNIAPFPFDPSAIDFVILTHAHLDHGGLPPRLGAQGFAGLVYATPATRDLLGVMLPDSAYVLNAEAARAAKTGRRYDVPYSLEEARAILQSALEASRGIVLVPAFAVGRTQDLLFHLHQMTRAGRIQSARVFVDSPMATEVTRITARHFELFDDEARRTVDEAAASSDGLRVGGSWTARRQYAYSVRRSPCERRSRDSTACPPTPTGQRCLHGCMDRARRRIRPTWSTGSPPHRPRSRMRSAVRRAGGARLPAMVRP
jgi:Cft2 family RNA processing exonuclease